MLSEINKNAKKSKNIFSFLHLPIHIENRSLEIPKASFIYCVIGVVSILLMLAPNFIAGLMCNPAILCMLIPFLFISLILFIYSIIMLIYTSLRALKNISKIYIPITSLFILLGFAFLLYGTDPMLHGLNVRFKTQFGYPKMREFAQEIALVPEDIFSDASLAEDSRYSKNQSKREALAKKYSFLGWYNGKGGVYIIDDIVEMSWGSALSGHWGFQVALKGKVSPIEKGTSLKVADDIQFVYYED